MYEVIHAEFLIQQEAEAPKPGWQRTAVRSEIGIIFTEHA